MFKFLFIYFLMYELIVLFNCEKYYNWLDTIMKKSKKDDSYLSNNLEKAIGILFILIFIVIPYWVFAVYLTAFGSDLKFYLGAGLLVLSLLHYFVSRKVKHYSVRFIDCLLTIALFLMYILESRNIINLIN